ncbi:hypothetical protein Mic7113_6114 [Allocoleopsis franciscana PCC 7113]|uniref:Uncharacterized protein n=1 Tax=Allocoleopsis franciscana PCC 7113 TaxID=1173027 RepID=K9WNF0_9CYAN|nr:hypothetical protein Mic7113_6114 [Allocoleopsis franciscana PCC 7113]
MRVRRRIQLFQEVYYLLPRILRNSLLTILWLDVDEAELACLSEHIA